MNFKTMMYVVALIFFLVLPVISNSDSGCCEPPAQEDETTVWTLETIDSPGVVGRWSSQALDSLGRIHVGYVDSSSDNLKYAVFSNSTWTNETVDNSGSVWNGISLTLDLSNNPHISYLDWDYDLHYAHWTGSSWSKEFVASTGSPTGIDTSTSLALDSADNPYVAFINSDSGEVVYAFKNGGWSFEIVDGPGNAYWVSLALDELDRPHVAYRFESEMDLKYARNVGGSWLNETIDSVGDVGFMPSLCVNSTDQPRIAYWDMGSGDLKYAEKNGTSWDIEIVDPDEASGMYASIAVDRSDRSGIAYHEANKRDLRYAYEFQGGWQVESVDTEGLVGYFPSLAFDLEDNPRISYYDNTQGDLKYAWGVVQRLPDLEVTDSDITSSPGSPVANGSSVRLEAIVRNVGTENASDVILRFYDGFPSLENRIGPDLQIVTLAAGANAIRQVDWTPTWVGRHEIAVQVDPDGNISESNETNNMAFLEIFVMTPYPDPPDGLWAHLSGTEFRDVTLNWTLSADDGGGENSVTGYRVFRGESFDPAGNTYGSHAWISKGASGYVDSLAGEGNPDNYFYIVCSENLFGNLGCTSSQGAKFTLPLARGFQLASLPLTQHDESIKTVLQTVKYDKAWFYDSSSLEWKWHMTFKDYRRGMWSVNHTMGMWVNVSEDCNLTVAGIVSVQTTIHLYEGWNLVSFPSFNGTYTVSDLRAEVGATRVEGYDSAPPNFLRVLGDTEVLLTGYGYWVKVEADVSWTVDVG